MWWPGHARRPFARQKTDFSSAPQASSGGASSGRSTLAGT